VSPDVAWVLVVVWVLGEHGWFPRFLPDRLRGLVDSEPRNAALEVVATAGRAGRAQGIANGPHEEACFLLTSVAAKLIDRHGWSLRLVLSS